MVHKGQYTYSKMGVSLKDSGDAHNLPSAKFHIGHQSWGHPFSNRGIPGITESFNTDAPCMVHLRTLGFLEIGEPKNCWFITMNGQYWKIWGTHILRNHHMYSQNNQNVAKGRTYHFIPYIEIWVLASSSAPRIFRRVQIWSWSFPSPGPTMAEDHGRKIAHQFTFDGVFTAPWKKESASRLFSS